MNGKLLGLIVCVSAITLLSIFGKYIDKTEKEEVRLISSSAVQVLNAELRGEYLRGFLDGASYQEVYRFHFPNTNNSPLIELDILIPEEQKAWERTHGKSLTNETERVKVEA